MDLPLLLPAFENIVEKGEIARNEQFLLFKQCFLLSQIIVFPFVHILDIKSSFAAELKEPKIDKSGKGLMLNRINKMKKRHIFVTNHILDTHSMWTTALHSFYVLVLVIYL